MDNYESIVRRLESEFDAVVSVREEGEVIEDNRTEELDIVIISHILSKSEQGEFDCPICYESIPRTKRVTISCNHDFCMGCTKMLIQSCNEQQQNVSCPMCRYSCFLLETPDEPQFLELSNMVAKIQEEQNNNIDACLYYQFT